MAKKKTHDEYVAELAIKNPNIVVLEQYINSQTPILHKCNLDGYVWKAAPHHISAGHGCPMCAGNVSYTVEQYIKMVEIINPNIEALGDYINAKTKILHRCKIDNYEWEAAPNHILEGHGCPECTKRMLSEIKRMTHEEYVKKVAICNPNIEVVGEYIDSKTPISHKCKIDDTEWMAKPANILYGKGCPTCAHNKLSDLLRKTHEEYVADVERINPDIEVIGQYIDSQTPIEHKCKQFGHVWMARPYNVLSNKGCPQCKQSKGEKAVARWLDEHGIQYIPQNRFPDCKDTKPLPFDFYLINYNNCVEFDGPQHFEPIDFAGKGEEWAKQQLKTTQYHDQIKNTYCSDNNIPLLRIPYFKNIEEELNNFLFI